MRVAGPHPPSSRPIRHPAASHEPRARRYSNPNSDAELSVCWHTGRYWSATQRFNLSRTASTSMVSSGVHEGSPNLCQTQTTSSVFPNGSAITDRSTRTSGGKLTGQGMGRGARLRALFATLLALSLLGSLVLASTASAATLSEKVAVKQAARLMKKQLSDRSRRLVEARISVGDKVSSSRWRF